VRRVIPTPDLYPVPGAAGHLLGLGHSDQPEDVMYPTTTVHDLTNRDRRTAGLLYALPPGSVKQPRPRR